MAPLGCLGHWYASLLYLVPVLGILGAVGVQHLRDRRAGIVHHDGPELHDDLTAGDLDGPGVADEQSRYASVR